MGRVSQTHTASWDWDRSGPMIHARRRGKSPALSFYYATCDNKKDYDSLSACVR